MNDLLADGKCPPPDNTLWLDKSEERVLGTSKYSELAQYVTKISDMDRAKTMAISEIKSNTDQQIAAARKAAEAVKKHMEAKLKEEIAQMQADHENKLADKAKSLGIPVESVKQNEKPSGRRN